MRFRFKEMIRQAPDQRQKPNPCREKKPASSQKVLCPQNLLKKEPNKIVKPGSSQA